MSRIDELKKQYPELNITMFDLLNRMDPTKTYKYMPLLCKLFGERFNPYIQWGIGDTIKKSGALEELHYSLNTKGISFENETINELYSLYQLTEYYPSEDFKSMKEFIERMEKNQVENKDVTSYKDLTSIRTAISLASLKEMDKELESQVIKEYEDDKWVIVRPLTFQASAKYGASTRWCTTYQKEKQYFERYWRRGILVYFINKQTGYKFAGFKALEGETEFSFWNAADNRVDYLEVEADDYLFPIVRRILNSNKTNKDFCSEELAFSVMIECQDNIKKMSLVEQMDVETPMIGREEPMMMEEATNEVMGIEVMEEQVLQPSANIRMLRALTGRLRSEMLGEDVTQRESVDEGPMQAG
jgi:hypothetical protein